MKFELEKAGNQYALPTDGKSKNKVLKEAGLSTSTAHRCEEIATIIREALTRYDTGKVEHGGLDLSVDKRDVYYYPGLSYRVLGLLVKPIPSFQVVI